MEKTHEIVFKKVEPSGPGLFEPSHLKIASLISYSVKGTTKEYIHLI